MCLGARVGHLGRLRHPLQFSAQLLRSRTGDSLWVLGRWPSGQGQVATGSDKNTQDKLYTSMSNFHECKLGSTVIDQMKICELDSFFQSIWCNRCAYILLFRFLDKKGFSIVSKLHVQVDWLSVHFNVNLEEFDISTLITTSSLEKAYSRRHRVYKPECAF